MLMKTYLYHYIFYASIILLACMVTIHVSAQTTSCDSVNEELSAKFRFLGDWNSEGTPNYMEPASDEVSQALIDFVNETLPEHVDFAESNEEYFDINVQLNTELTEASEVYLTMVHEGANWKNTLGFYTYEIDNPPSSVDDIDSLVILFPNVSQPDVIKPGDKIKLGDFPANTAIGYFLMARGWVGDTICISSHIIFTDSHLNTFTSEEYRQQTILLSNEQEDKFLLGFEDIIRPGGDQDFNDAVFYITATPGAIDTTDVAKVPTGLLSGDTVLCDENAPANIKVALTGEAPWTIVYNDGTEDIEVSGIEDEVFSFQTIVKDTIKLVSVKDKTKFGIPGGEAIVKLSHPKAIINEEEVICNDGDDKAGFIIKFEGEAPFSISYKIEDEEKTVDNILENEFIISGVVGETVELISMSDRYCDGLVEGGQLTIQSYTNPSLTIEGNGAVCGEISSTLFDLNLDGEGPWTLNYAFDGDEISLPIESSVYQLQIDDLGSLTFNSIQNEHCTVQLQSTIEIANYELPTASIEDFENLCGESEAIVNVSLTGNSPWIVDYRMNGVESVIESNEESLAINIDEAGSFELLGVSDTYCENSAEGILDIGLHELPTALISGGGTVCNDEEVLISIDLTGAAPFTVSYTNNQEDTIITTGDSKYEFSTNEFGSYTLLSVEDAFCQGTVEGTVSVMDGSEDIQAEIQSDDISCYSEDIELELIGDTENLEVQWTTDGDGTLQNSNEFSVIYMPAEEESGLIEFFAEISNGCNVKTIGKEISILDEIVADFELSPSKDLLSNSQITFTPVNSGYDEYSWNFGDENTSTATIATNEYSNGGIYIVKLTAIKDECEGTSEQEIEVYAKDELYVPNAFNPSALNSENQVVKVYGSNVDAVGFSFKIVNRWGKVMYETKSFSEANQVGWQGENKNTSEELELNVFTYILKGKFIEGSPFERTGTITQIK